MWVKLGLSLFLCYSATGWSSSHRPDVFLKKIAGSKDEGAQIVSHYCANCHAVKPLIPLGAPRIGQLADWEVRAKPGLTALFLHADEGIGAMPSRGGCFECTDQQLMLAIVELLPDTLRNSLINEHKKYK